MMSPRASSKRRGKGGGGGVPHPTPEHVCNIIFGTGKSLAVLESTIPIPRKKEGQNL